jgi:hypothetical protein
MKRRRVGSNSHYVAFCSGLGLRSIRRFH